MPSGPAPNTTLWLVLSILATLFCCLPFGIVAIVYTAMAMSRAGAGDYAGANDKLRFAKIWFWVSVGVSLLFLILYVVLVALGLVAGLGAAAAGGGGFSP
jgi:hypothetical protein